MKQFVALILALLLAGCLKVATTGYDVATDLRSAEVQKADTEIEAKITADLLQSSVKGTGKLSVFCRNGIVVLAGVVEDGSQAGTEAVRIAGQVEGVKKVETYFLPNQPSVTGDFEIKEKIHFKMVGDADLKASQVDMKVIDGHVVLVGVVGSSDKVSRIIAIANSTEGVKAVKSFIQVMSR
jgi:osmotically-inducible protein OsmY